MANLYMLDVKLKGQSPAEYQQIACVEQMDNDYVFGEKQHRDGGKSCRKKKNSFLNGQEHRGGMNISAMFRERAWHNFFNLLITALESLISLMADTVMISMPWNVDCCGKTTAARVKKKHHDGKCFKTSSKHICSNRRPGHPVCFSWLTSPSLPVSLGRRCRRETEPSHDPGCLIKMAFSILVLNKSWPPCPLATPLCAN